MRLATSRHALVGAAKSLGIMVAAMLTCTSNGKALNETASESSESSEFDIERSRKSLHKPNSIHTSNSR